MSVYPFVLFADIALQDNLQILVTENVLEILVMCLLIRRPNAVKRRRIQQRDGVNKILPGAD